jgi:hypothetical protein
MSDLPSALGIEAVEFVADGGRSVAVRVTGRWRRRRPELRGQPMLVVETGTVRQRFVAMPEPPSLTGAAPGTWRMSFTVPAELAPHLPGNTFLQLGAVMVPLPIGDVALPGGDAVREVDGPASELFEVARIEGELARAREESDRLREEIAERERRLRSSEQHVHAERARRIEVEQALADKTRAATHDLRLLHEHVADLERELGRLRRAVDEARHLAAAAEARRADAEAGRAAAEGRLAERSPPAPEPAPAVPPPSLDRARANRIASELSLVRAVATGVAAPSARATATATGVTVPAPAIPPARAADHDALGLEAAMVEYRAAGLERELVEARRELVEARRDLAGARRELERQRLLCERAYEAIDRVRGELARLGGDAPAEPAAPVPAPSGPVQAEKLSAALARLREGTPPAIAEEAASEPAAPPTESPAHAQRPAKAWLGKAFRTLAARDPSSAGRLALALLPAQRAADPVPVAYDLVLGDLATARVTVSISATQVDLGDAPRPPDEVDFQLVGDLASIARLLAAGRVRRRLGRLPVGGRLARVRGDRGRLGALERLLDAPLTLGQLHAAGVRLDPVLALTVAALIIEPAWTAGERFTIAHREPPAPIADAYLQVRAGKPPLAGAEAPHGPVATEIVCPADELVAVLGGEPGTGEAMSGDERSLALVRQWLDRAQCG